MEDEKKRIGIIFKQLHMQAAHHGHCAAHATGYDYIHSNNLRGKPLAESGIFRLGRVTISKKNAEI
jgi:hypothetical protein